MSAQCLVSGESNREDMWVETVEDSLKRVGAYAKVSVYNVYSGLSLILATLGDQSKWRGGLIARVNLHSLETF